MKTYNERTQSIKNKVKSKRDRRVVIWTASSVACVLLVLTVVCSLPILGNDAPPINAYKKDEYYPLIQKINQRYEGDKYSIFQQFGESIDHLGAVGDAAVAPSGPVTDAPTAPGSSNESQDGNATNNGNKYEENTLNQVDGVIEGDVLKRSTTHAFYLKNGYSKNSEPCLLLQVYKLAGSDTAVVSENYIRAKDETSFSRYNSYIQSEMFLNDDATRLTVITSCLSKQNIVYTTVISLDVTDVSNIVEVNRVYVSGAYVSSRLVDGKLLVITSFNAWSYSYFVDEYRSNPIDYSKKETYIPQCGSKLGDDFIPMDDIYVPEQCQQINYTVLAMLDEATLKVDDSYAVFSYTQDVYVSRDYVVVMRNNYYYYKDRFDYGNEIDATAFNSPVSVRVCETVALSYKNGFENKGEIGLDGYVKDRYSMDEKDGVLRVFTTVNQSQSVGQFATRSTVNVSLYCVDLNTMEIVASKERFAPQGDEVKSARFEGDKAYVCTARRNTDPVFYFDLSDLSNITYVDTGEIDGFSVNLIKFNDLLLGIGQGENSMILKIELYQQSDDENAENGVVGVCKYERKGVSFSYEYKAHFVNAEHNLIGLHIFDYQDDLVTSNPNANRNKYLLLRYDAETNSLAEVYCEEFDSHYDYDRAFYEHNGVYVFGTNAFAFIDLSI